MLAVGQDGFKMDQCRVMACELLLEGWSFRLFLAVYGRLLLLRIGEKCTDGKRWALEAGLGGMNGCSDGLVYWQDG